ncbi:MAG: hypothetical protein J6N18_05810 [Kiritimatiellae bacterium]|nr:hypothetical protein [Kiritimatiellia bacterium]
MATNTLTGARTTCLAFAILTFVATGLADYVKLLESDKDGSAAQGESSYMSSFLFNPTEEGYGWEDGQDPDPGKDYLVSGKILRTPCRVSDSLNSVTFKFPGRSLRVTDGGSIVFRSSWGNVSNYATVEFGDLIMCKGKLDNGTWARPTRWGGKITIDSSDYSYAKNSVSFNINLVTCYIPAKLVSSNRESVLLGGTTATATSSSGVYRWVSDFEKYGYRFEGDCTEYFATNNCGWGVQARVATSDFAGSFNLGNASAITVDGVFSAVIRGAIMSRDGTIRVPASAALDVRGGIDCAFADFESHVSGGLNVYTRLPSSESYVNTNYVTGGSSKQVPINAILLEANAELFTAKADLAGTLVKIPSGATFTVGDAVFNDVILDIAAGGRLVLTNSFTAKTPVKLRLNGIGIRTAVATLPVGNGELKAEDFTFENAPQFRYSASVETVEGIQTLWITDINPDVKNETTGYVIQKTADGHSSSSFTIGSYNMAGNWSETDKAPHSGTNYYTARLLRDKGASSKTFGGDSLTQAGVFRLSRATFEISDWRVISNGETAIGERTGLTTAGSTATFTFEGMLTVFATKESPFTLYGGISTLNGDGTVKSSQTYVMNMKIRGDPNSAISADGALTRSPGVAKGQAVCEFPGDMSEYYGTIFVGTNETIRLGRWGLTNGTLVARTAYSTVTTTADAGSFVPVKRYISQTASSISVPAGTEMAITDGADITGVLTKSGDGLLTFGGTAVAGNGAALNITAGLFGVKSADAVNGMPVTFGDGARLFVDVEATGDLKDFGLRNVATDTPFIVDGDGSLPVSFVGEFACETATVAVLTVSATAAVPSISLPERCSRLKVSTGRWRENADGSRTFEASFVLPGFTVIVR